MADWFDFHNTKIQFLQPFETGLCENGSSPEALWKGRARDAIRRDLGVLSVGAMRRLRALLLESGGAAMYRLSDREVLEQLAARIERGSIRVLRCREPVIMAAASGGADTVETPSDSPAPPRRSTPPPKKEKTWIEVRLVDSSGKPVAGAAYKLKLTDGRVEEGSLDGNGAVRVEDIDPGICQITFPELDAGDWEAA